VKPKATRIAPAIFIAIASQLAGCAFSLSLAGCSTSRTENTATIREDQFEIFIGNKTLASDLSIENARTRRGSNNFLEFQAMLVNNTTDDMRFQWIVEWFDSQGFRLEDPTSSWRPAILNPKAELPIRRVAPMIGAARAKLRVMPVDEFK
jgi:uncharacterized protein YcfL